MEDNRREPGRSDDKQQPRRGQFWPVLIIVVLAFLLVRNLVGTSAYEDIDYNLFVRELKNNNISSVEVNKKTKLAVGEFEVAPTKQATGEDEEDPGSYSKKFSVELPDNYDELLQPYADGPESSDISIRYTNNDAAEWFTLFMLFGVPLILILVIWLMFRRTRDQIMGGGGFLSSFSRSTAKRYEPSDKQTTFKDVAGLEGVKADLQEIVDFLKAPEKFQRLGGRIPKGVLLNGPPGTGKTLLARAVAGEAGVPFYSVNGSEFIQMFVGVGASRVRDLFQTAKENAPAIIFVDEIDAVGRQRGAGLGGGHDEREQTLNQILGEMDGFSGVDSVIVVAATNRPDVLDPALLRPGRFDRHVTVGRPTYKGRHEIFKVHTRDVPLDHDVDLKRLAAVTIGLTGADIRNVVNEAALWAARNDRRRVHMEDFDYARDKVLMGAKREELLKQDEKEKTAYHEAGHTLAAWYLKGAQRVHKVTIIPRGRSLGSTQIIPTEDRVSSSEQELLDQLVVLLAGRAAEKIIYDEGTVGAENDLERATSMARRMVTHWGMSPKLGPVSYKTSDEDPFLGREMHQSRQFSEHTQEMIDDEVSRILNDASQRALDLLEERKAELESLTKKLLAEEELGEQQIEDLIGQSVHGPASSFLAFSNGDEPSDESDGESADGRDHDEASSETTSEGSNGEAVVDQTEQAKKNAEATSSAAGVPSGNEANRVEPGDATS